MVKRIEYIDITKGFLIILVVFHHIVNVARGIMNTDYLEWIKATDTLYVPFFMQAFFFITGYCSSFKKDGIPFVFSNIKTLVIPFLAFSLLNQAVESVVLGNSFFFVDRHGHKEFFLFELFWFLPALFFAKIWIYGITRLTSSSIKQGLIVFALLIFGTLLIGKPIVVYYNWFHWHNALCMTLFLWIGFYFRENNLLDFKWIKFSGFLYFIVIFLLVIYNKLVPYYTTSPHFNIKYVWLYMYLAITGTLMVMSVFLGAKNFRFLRFLGENSIVIYGVHFVYIAIIEYFLHPLFPINNHINGLFFYLMVGVGALFLCYITCLIFQRKPFKYVTGKF